MLRILIVEEFDPAGVCLSHRDLLREAGHDVRVLLESAYTARQLDADWVTHVSWTGEARMSPEMAREILDFASHVDVIQFSPGIGQPWADAVDPCGLDLPRRPLGVGGDVPELQHLRAPWETVVPSKARWVAMIHGSANMWAHRERYAAHYRGLGWELAATTIDYATELGAAYLPPYVDLGPPIPFFKDGETLWAIQSPTNHKLCHAAEFRNACLEAGVSYRMRSGCAHQPVIEAKRASHIGFDHLRGSFSVNHLENAKLGLAAICSLRREYALRLKSEGILEPPLLVEDQESLTRTLIELREHPARVRAAQLASHDWAMNYFSRSSIRNRIVDFYEGL